MTPTTSLAACAVALVISAAAAAAVPADRRAVEELLPVKRGGTMTIDGVPAEQGRGEMLDPARDPLKFLGADMTAVVADLSKLETGPPVQEKQTSIVARLDKLIEELEKACSGGAAGSGGRNPTKPLADSVIVGGPGGVGDLHAPKAGGRDWGQLPPRQREQILQSKTEGFPPGYEQLLQTYYRRLAEEQVVAADAEPTAE